MAHFVRLNDIWSMLDECAKGYTRKSSDEYWTVRFNGRSYRSLPLGPHGARKNPDIETGHVRSMVRFFEIKDCADKVLDLK